MLTYTDWGDPDGCIHQYDGVDVHPEVADELDAVITEAVTSLRDRIRYLEGHVTVATQKRDAVEKELAATQQQVRILTDFIQYVLKISEGGPRTSLEDLQKRAHRALAFQERTESRPPRRPA